MLGMVETFGHTLDIPAISPEEIDLVFKTAFHWTESGMNSIHTNRWTTEEMCGPVNRAVRSLDGGVTDHMQ